MQGVRPEGPLDSWPAEDRADDLTALEGRSRDVVIDNSGARTEWTRSWAELLNDTVGHYLYGSSTGVSYPYLTTEIGEETEVDLVDASEGENGSAAYGVVNAASELAAPEAFGEDRTLAIRPGYIVGPADRSDRKPFLRLQPGENEGERQRRPNVRSAGNRRETLLARMPRWGIGRDYPSWARIHSRKQVTGNPTNRASIDALRRLSIPGPQDQG